MSEEIREGLFERLISKGLTVEETLESLEYGTYGEYLNDTDWSEVMGVKEGRE